MDASIFSGQPAVVLFVFFFLVCCLFSTSLYCDTFKYSPPPARPPSSHHTSVSTSSYSPTPSTYSQPALAPGLPTPLPSPFPAPAPSPVPLCLVPPCNPLFVASHQLRVTIIWLRRGDKDIIPLFIGPCYLPYCGRSVLQYCSLTYVSHLGHLCSTVLK